MASSERKFQARTNSDSAMEIFLTRQPVFDRQQKVSGYELLLRSDLESPCKDNDRDESIFSSMAFGFLSTNMATLTRGKWALVNFSRQMLTEHLALAPSSSKIAIEMATNGGLDADILEVYQRLKQAGHDFVADADQLDVLPEPGYKLLDIIKVDVRKTGAAEQQTIVNSHRGKGLKFLAYNVDLVESLNQTFEIGFTHFQGSFYTKPRFRPKKEMAFSNMNHMQLLREVNDPDVKFKSLARIIKHDVSLSYKLLKYINSAYFGLPNEIRSIQYALSMLGLLNIRKWLAQMALYEIGKDKTEELVVSSIVRARFCELLAEEVGMSGKGPEFFMMGLFSRLDAFLDQELADILQELPVPLDIKNALLGKEDSPFYNSYQLVCAYEQGEWQLFADYAEKLRLPQSKAPVLFLKAIEWSHQVF